MVKRRVPCLLVLLCVLVPASLAFDLREVTIRIDRSGDATITAVSDENPAEYIAMRSAGIAGTTVLKGLAVSGPIGNIRLLCSGYGVLMLRAEGFADIRGTTYETPTIGFPPQLSSHPVVTIIFPDGYYERQTADGTILPVTHILGAQSLAAAPEPALQCRTSKNLPLSGIIPDELAPAVSVAAAIALTSIGVTAFGSAISSWFAGIMSFLENAAGGVIANMLADRDRKNKSLEYITERRAILGFSVREVCILAAGALLIGILFFFATRDPVDPVLLGIYIVMGGVALIFHEIGHWYLTKRYECYTEVRFWGLGAIIMLLTSWLFGNVFAQPTVTLVRHRVPLDERGNGLIMLSGPVLSALIALGCLCLIPFGGVLATAGMIGFMINLMTGIFELLPIRPCDGSDVKRWNPAVWVLVFVPLMIIYLAVTW